MGNSISSSVPRNPAGHGSKESGSEPQSRLLYQDARETSSLSSESRKLYEEAVDNAQYVMAYASSKCMKDVDQVTIEKLIRARNHLERNEEVRPDQESEFWIAYQDLWKVVRPLTAECIRATEGPKARKTINWHIGFTIFVLLILLILQIYWVIGNQLTTKLADLLQQEATLSSEISANQDEYNAIELRFKLDEMDSEGYQGYFTYLGSPEFERDTAANRAARTKLDSELESLKSQLERNGTILRAWSSPWFWLIQPALNQQTSELDTEIKSNSDQIEKIDKLLEPDSTGQTKTQIILTNIRNLESELGRLESQSPDYEAKLSELNTAYANYDYYSQMEQQLQSLKDTNNSLNLQKISKSLQEKSRQAQLAAIFVLIILQSYLLPLLYGLLGASTSSLRYLSREIDQVIFSDKRRIQHVLRIALGALSGIMVGWFSFLYEGSTLLGSVPPLAIAFLVGYNIELFFSLMDRLIDAVKKPGKTGADKDAKTKSSPSPTPTTS
jgi:hypothetical protein